MLIGELFRWWYGPGWHLVSARLFSRVVGVLDAFSVGRLIKTMFYPFKQVSVLHISGSLSTQITAWLDLQVSRFIGAATRLLIILTGLVLAAVMAVIASCLVVLWLLLPVLPALALIAYAGVRH